MAYLLDSDVVIDHLGDDPATRRLLDQLASDGLTINLITYMEIYQGALMHPDPAAASRRRRRAPASASPAT